MKTKTKTIKITIICVIILALIILGIAFFASWHFSINKHYNNQGRINPSSKTTWVCDNDDIAMQITYYPDFGDCDRDDIATSFVGTITLKDTDTVKDVAIDVANEDKLYFSDIDGYDAEEYSQNELFSGEFDFSNDDDFELKIDDNDFLPDNIKELEFTKSSSASKDTYLNENGSIKSFKNGSSKEVLLALTNYKADVNEIIKYDEKENSDEQNSVCVRLRLDSEKKQAFVDTIKKYDFKETSVDEKVLASEVKEFDWANINKDQIKAHYVKVTGLELDNGETIKGVETDIYVMNNSYVYILFY